MSTQQSTQGAGELIDDLSETFFRRYYADEIAELAQHYPNEQRSLTVDYDDLYKFDHDFADDFLTNPWKMREYLEEALRTYDLSIDISLGRAHVRVANVPEEYTFYPGGFSPSKNKNLYRCIRGEVTKTSDVYPKIEEAGFECQLCGVITHVPQSDHDFQEPYECRGCERQGPFRVNLDESEFVDAQKIRLKTPAELAGRSREKIPAYVEDDIAGEVTIGDRVKISGIVQLRRKQSGNKKGPEYNPYLEGHHIEVEQTDRQEIDISTDERKEIERLASGEEGDPLELGAMSLSEKVFGYETEKKALILAMASGGTIEYDSGDRDRTDLHVFLIGDPSTGKSKLVERAADVGWRTESVTSRRATGPGLTATAEHDDFGDEGYSLKAGAFVRANGGTVCIDELDDMDPNVRSFLLEPMANQKFTAQIAGEKATFETETSVIAAGNPRDGRFDPHEAIFPQFDFRSDLISRFDLIFTIKDEPDEEADRELADHVLEERDEAKKASDDDESSLPVDSDLLRKWIALAKQQPVPPFESEEVKAHLREAWLEVRGMYEYTDSGSVPVVVRDLEGIVRIAESAAKFELADEITMRHARLATELMGDSMRDIGQNQDGEFDADVKEVGTSKSQRDRMQTIAKAFANLQTENGGDAVPEGDVLDHLEDEYGIDRSTAESDIQNMKNKGVVIEPPTGGIKYVGGS